MTEPDPTATQRLRAIILRKGHGVVAVTLLRHYWKALMGVATAAVSFGIFLAHFYSLEESVRTLAMSVQDLHTELDTVKNQQAALQASWNVVATEAAIVIKPKDQPPRQKRTSK